MPNRPASHSPSGASGVDNAADAPRTGKRADGVDASLNPDREYQDATESKLDHSKPPHHGKTAADDKHKDGPQISVGKP